VCRLGRLYLDRRLLLVLRNRATISRDPPVHPGGFALGAIGNVHRRRRIGRPCLTADGPAGDGCLLAQTGMTPTQSRRDTSPATIVSDRDSDRDRHAGRSACNSASPRPRVIDIPAANTARSRRGTRAARPIRRCLLTSARAHKIAIGESGLTTSALDRFADSSRTSSEVREVPGRNIATAFPTPSQCCIPF
jgi:hypothetical protein